MASCNGQVLRDAFGTATSWLEHNAAEIDSLNVFPVPDGDTGTNMVLTMRTAMEEVSRSSDNSASAIAKAMAWGALMGARGNSGVILSQILRGLAQGLEGKESFDGGDIAAALAQSSSLAYKAVTQPVEGTILTVIREVAAAANNDSANADLLTLMESLVAEAKASVARTPSLLSVLHEAGVVDAGGQGLYVLLEGILHYLRGEEIGEIIPGYRPSLAVREVAEPFYGYCTEFLLKGENLDIDEIKSRLSQLGESVLVVGDEGMVRVHVHTLDPGAAISYATSLGVLHQVKVDNMQEQHRHFIAAEEELPQPSGAIVPVAVVSGKGLSRVFTELGAAIVHGGDTMNPSVQELLQRADSLLAEEVVLLPNDPNIVPAALQVQSLTEKRVGVVPTKTIPQGIAALLSFNPDADLAANVRAMTEVISAVRSGELTTAVRSMKWGELKVNKGQAIALLDGDLVAAADTMPQALYMLLAKMGLGGSELITIYYGADAPAAEAEEIAQFIRSKYPKQRLELVMGGQPYYNYIVSVE
jgi:hypothetical protein